MTNKMKTTKATLQIENLTYGYAKTPILNNCTSNLESGLTFLRGINGSGKTTLMQLIGGALTMQDGAIELHLNGAVIGLQSQPLLYRQNCFYCRAEAPPFAWLSVNEWLQLMCSLYPALQQNTLHRHIAAFDLTPLLRQSISSLSLGQAKKMMLAIALASNTPLLLLDEPLNGLDSVSIDYFLKELAQLSDRARPNRQIILMTSHIAGAGFDALADGVLQIVRGQLQRVL